MGPDRHYSAGRWPAGPGGPVGGRLARRAWRGAAALAAALALSFAPSAGAGASPIHGGPAASLQVVASFPSLAAIAHEVGGVHVQVRALASVGEDPHFVDPRPSLVLALRGADLLLANGLELDASWLTPVQRAARNPRIQVGAAGYLEASSFVVPLEVPAVKIDRSMGDLHPGGNPHFLSAPEPVARIALGLAERYAQLDPAHAADYQAHAKVLAAGLRQQAGLWRRRFATLPPARRQVVTYHKSMAYLIDWLDLQEVGTVEPRPGVPPDPAHVAALLRRMRQRQVPMLLQEAYYPAHMSQSLAKLAPAQLVTIPGQVRFKGSDHQTYRDHLAAIAQSLWAVAAAGQPPPALD